MSAIVSAADLASIEFQGLALPKPFGPFLGEIEPKTAVFVWGPPGSGKTTWVLDLAGLLAAHVDVLFVASEQAGPGRTLQDKAARLKLPPHVHFTDFEDLATLKRQVKRGYGAVVVDSAQSVEAIAGRGTMNELRAWCEAQGVLCIYMAHAYKDGSTYKGDSAWAHYAGIEVHIEEGIARTRKNRYADLGEMKVRFVVKKRTEVRRNPSCDPLSFDDAVSRTTVRAAQREVQARIRWLYKHHGTWKAVAEALNVSTSTLRNWRTGVPVSKSAMALISTQCELLPEKPAAKKKPAPKPKPQNPKPTRKATKQEQIAVASGTSSGRVDRLPFGSIHVDPKRFQPRDAAFAEQSVQRIVDNFDARELDPLRVWRNPKTKLWYVLAGHSRHEALRRLIERGDLRADYPVPVDPYEGTVEEAIDFAHRENNKGTEQSAAENAVYLRRFIGEDSKTALRERARTLYGRNGNTVLYLAHLAPNGSAINALRLFSNTTTSESRDVETMAAWLGQLRMSDDRLTDAHENEIWTWLKENYKTKGKKVTSYGGFSEWMKRVIEPRATFGELPERLNIAGVIPVSMQQQAIGRQVAEAEQALREAKRDLETKRRELVRKGATHADLDRILKRYNDAVTIAQRELLRVRQEAGNAAAQLKQQEVSLFDTMRANPAGALIYLGTVADIDGLAQGYELFHDASGNRLLALPPLNVERIESIPVDAGAIEQFEAWSGYEADGGMAVSLPGDDPISLGYAGSIRYTSDKLMEEGDAKGMENAYQHHFDADARRLYAWGEAYIVDEVKVSSRGLMN